MRRVVLVDDERLARRRLRRLLDAVGGVDIVAECVNGSEAVELLRAASVDVVFLDVQMPGLDGFEVIEAIGVDAMPPVVFVTAFEQYAIRAFEDNALDYLVKPIEQERLARTLARVVPRDGGSASAIAAMLDQRKLEGSPSRFLVKETGRTIIVQADEIERVCSEGNYVRLHTREESYLLRDTMERLSSQLDGEFVRIHRQTMVRVALIRELVSLSGGELEVVLQSGSRLSVGRSYRAHLSRAISS